MKRVYVECDDMAAMKTLCALVASTATLALAACGGGDDGGDGESVAQRCTDILQWSFQEGNSILEHPDYDWYRRNCE